MLRYIIKRIILSLVIIWGVLTACFIMMHLAPGDPADLYITPEIQKHVVENIRSQMGFDLPLWQQYFMWVKEFLSGNFGVSFIHQRPVLDVFKEAIPNTLQLTAVVFVFQYIAGIGLGMIGAVNQGRKSDHLISAVLLFLYSMPGFWMALLAILVFTLKLGWLPSSQMQSMYELSGFWPVLWDRILHLIMPVMVLSVPFIAYTARFVRSSLIEILAQPYILAARAYGLKKHKILFQYALKNSLLPLVTLIGLYLPFLLGGAVITEYIFAWPGMGRITVNAIFSHDFPMILASNFFAACAVVTGNLISDILYQTVDPRIRKEAPAL